MTEDELVQSYLKPQRKYIPFSQSGFRIWLVMGFAPLVIAGTFVSCSLAYCGFPTWPFIGAGWVGGLLVGLLVICRIPWLAGRRFTNSLVMATFFGAFWCTVHAIAPHVLHRTGNFYFFEFLILVSLACGAYSVFSLWFYFGLKKTDEN